MYLIIKLAELCCQNYITSGVFVEMKSQLIILIYSLATATVFNAAILEPGNVPLPYMNFLNKLTKNKLSYVNRILLK